MGSRKNGTEGDQIGTKSFSLSNLTERMGAENHEKTGSMKPLDLVDLGTAQMHGTKAKSSGELEILMKNLFSIGSKKTKSLREFFQFGIVLIP